jgi:hypothetical protein
MPSAPPPPWDAGGGATGAVTVNVTELAAETPPEFEHVSV